MISVVIPTYNEAENIAKLVKGIKNSLKNRKYEIIIVDDNSPDNTAKIAISLKNKFPIKVIKRKTRGLSSAVIAGFRFAKGDIIGVMDADLSHPQKKIPELIKALEKQNYDLAIGSRHIKGGGVEEWPFYRKTMSKFATLLARPLTNAKDPMSGFFFFKKKILKNVKLNPIGYKILLEILVKGKQKNIKEIPYIFRNRKIGKSKIGAKVYLDYLRHIFRLLRYKIMRHK
ncbi:polyprenol monophosphomannose synthase [Candidatus Woesearchaeota archaeon]|nr:polyprenol monophosphomannose synthase [Candidatus Woesearchaeota archaeon]